MFTELAFDRRVREDRLHEFGVCLGHDPFGCSDDECFKTRSALFERFEHGLGPVTGVNVRPQIPLAKIRVCVIARKGRVVFWRHDIGEPKRGDAELWVPTNELLCELLFEVLDYRVH